MQRAIVSRTAVVGERYMVAVQPQCTVRYSQQGVGYFYHGRCLRGQLAGV